MEVRYSVLIMEDDPDMQELFRLILEQDGYAVESTESGVVALNLLKNSKHYDPFSLILLDYNLADMSALEFLKKKEMLPMANEIPIILCSAAADLVRSRLPKGVVDIILKPFQISDLLNKVKFHTHQINQTQQPKKFLARELNS